MTHAPLDVSREAGEFALESFECPRHHHEIQPAWSPSEIRSYLAEIPAASVYALAAGLVCVLCWGFAP